MKDIVGYFVKDNCIFVWDVWNELDNLGGGDYDVKELKDKF